MPSEDCLNIRLADYLQRRRDPDPDAAGEEPEEAGDPSFLELDAERG
jgi:hypothetical protein